MMSFCGDLMVWVEVFGGVHVFWDEDYEGSTRDKGSKGKKSRKIRLHRLIRERKILIVLIVRLIDNVSDLLVIAVGF